MMKNNTIKLLAFLCIYPMYNFPMAHKANDLIQVATAQLDAKKTTIAVCALGVGCLAYSCLKPKNIDHVQVTQTFQQSLSDADAVARSIIQLYNPLISHNAVSSCMKHIDNDTIETLEDQSLPSYKTLYPILESKTLDNAIQDQVMSGNYADFRVTVQFPFIAFHEKLKLDQQTIIVQEKNLKALEDQCNKYYQDLAKQTTAQTAHDTYNPILHDLQTKQAELTILKNKLAVIYRRIPFLEQTIQEYPRYEAWETEQKRITALQQIQNDLSTVKETVNNQNTRIANLEYSAAATHDGLEATRNAIETMHRQHHPDCHYRCTHSMISFTELLAAFFRR